MPTIVTLLHPQATLDHLGFIPSFLDENDPRPATEQFDTNYCGGWHPQPRITISENFHLCYPGDPPLPVLAMIEFNGETILIYNYGYVAVINKIGKTEACRLD